MKASQLLGAPVIDADGELIGRVHDLRFELTRPPLGRTIGWTCRLTGLVCGGRTPLGHRLGYGTGDMAGPWPLSTFFRRRRESGLEIDWQEVRSVDASRIQLARRGDDYQRHRHRRKRSGS